MANTPPNQTNLDPSEDQELSNILNQLFTGLKTMTTATTDAQREALRQPFMDRMRDIRRLTARNIRAGIQGAQNE